MKSVNLVNCFISNKSRGRPDTCREVRHRSATPVCIGLVNRCLSASLANKIEVLNLCINDTGRVAEWLGRGLQNLVQQFKSARDLTKSLSVENGKGFLAFQRTKVDF